MTALAPVLDDDELLLDELELDELLLELEEDELLEELLDDERELLELDEHAITGVKSDATSGVHVGSDVFA